MKKTMKKGIALLLAMLLLLTSFSGCTSYDENYAIFELWVAGVKVTTRNQSDILGDGTVSYVGDGTSGVLTLNGANIAESSDPDAEAVIVSLIDDLTIQLVGENQIGMGEKAPVNGISAFDLTIKGEGSLDIAARASCIKGNTFIVESGKIDTYVKTADDEIASFIGVGFWAQELLEINGGDIQVHYLAGFSPLSYGLYCVQELVINGGKIAIDPMESQMLAIGLIASEKLSITGGYLSVYGFDDAMNAKTFVMTGGKVNADAVDLFADGACRLVNKAEFSGGELTVSCLMKMDPESITLYSKDLVLNGMSVSGGDFVENLAEKDAADYEYKDACIRIEKEVN